MFEEIVSFLLQSAEEALYSLLPAFCVAQQRSLSGTSVHGLSVASMLELFSHTQAVRLQLVYGLALFVHLLSFLQHSSDKQIL